MTATQKVHMLCCASSFVVAAYAKVRLTPQESRALPLELFAKPSQMRRFTDFSGDIKRRDHEIHKTQEPK